MELSPQAKRVFQTQTYAPRPTIDGVHITELKRHDDDGGSMTELARLADGMPQTMPGFTVRQINFSEIAPGTIKAFHVHAHQTDVWFVPPIDRVLIVLADVRRGSRTEGATMRFMLGNGASRVVRIPPGVAHGAKNLAPDTTGHIIYLTDLHFSPDPAECDEGRLPWDYLGADVWDVTRG
jgi:dTDP-4-dehydrorhamnose 3,5-epimerase